MTLNLMALGAIGTVVFLGKKWGENNVTIISHHSPNETVNAGKIKMDVNSDEPEILLDEVVDENPAKTGVCTIRISKATVKKIAGKSVRVILGDKEAKQLIPLSLTLMQGFLMAMMM